MELDNAVNNLDNVEQIDSDLSALASIDSDIELEDQLDTDLGELVQVEVRYTGEETDNIIVNVDNGSNKISATLKKIIYNSRNEFPEVGSDKLLYIDLSNTSIWFYDTSTATYKEAVNTEGLATEDFVTGLLSNYTTTKDLEEKYATNENVDNIKQELQTNIDKTNESVENLESNLQEQINNTNAKFDNYATNSRVDEIEGVAKGANQAVSFGNYSTMITVLNALGNSTYNIGQNIMIVTLEVPDLWISGISATSVPYAYTSDADFANALKMNGSVQVGYYFLSALETQKVDLTDYVKNTDFATKDTAGVVIAKAGGNGVSITKDGILQAEYATTTDITNRESYRKPITPINLDHAVITGLTSNKTELTDEEKTAARTWLGISGAAIPVRNFIEV